MARKSTEHMTKPISNDPVEIIMELDDIRGQQAELRGNFEEAMTPLREREMLVFSKLRGWASFQSPKAKASA